MSHLTIKVRIWLLGLLAIVSVVVAGGFGVFQLSKVNAELESDLADVRVGINALVDIQQGNVAFKTQIQEWKNILIRGNNEEAFAKYEKSFYENEKQVQIELKAALSALKKENAPESQPYIASLEKIIQDHAELGVVYKSALAGFNKADPEAGKKVDVAVRGKDRAATDGLNKLIEDFQGNELQQLELQIESSQKIYSQSRNILLGFMAVILLVSLIVVLVTVSSISRQIEVVQETTSAIKTSLDLTRRIPVAGRDELSTMAASFNILLDEFQNVVRRMKGAGDQVARSSDGLSHSVFQLSSSVAQQNEATASMAASVEEMAVSVAHVSDASGTAQEIAKSSFEQAETGGQVIETTVNQMISMAGKVRNTSELMGELAKRTDEIGSIASVIKDIADQTNLLALNAAIEAARAGEQGRGFAVVADEVRKLAERTAKATTEISVVITAIQDETHHAVTDMATVVTQVTSNAEAGRIAGQSIIQIREGSSRVVNVASDIAYALKEQTTASDLIAKQVEVIANMSEENTIAMNETQLSSAELKRLSDDMHAMVERFKV